MSISEKFSWVNPYLKILDTFPGRLFPYDQSQEKDDLEIQDLLVQRDIVYCEFGSGSGKHTIELARRNPNATVLGFELRFKRAVRTIQKAQKHSVENVYVLRTRAEDFVRIFPKNSLDAVYVNFPDPWAKKKQKKHRLLSKNFFEQLPLYLKHDAYFSFKTDHLEYFHSTVELLKENTKLQIVELSEDLYESEYFEQSIDTEFENLFSHQGLKINYLKAVLKLEDT